MEMLLKIPVEYPELYTKKGELSKREPKKYICECGHAFNKTQKLNFPGIGFAIPVCTECGNKGKASTAHGIWKRMKNRQIEQEDYILEVVTERSSIQYEELEQIMRARFEGYSGEALRYLVYFGYMNVDKELRDNQGIVVYSINRKKDLVARYENLR